MPIPSKLHILKGTEPGNASERVGKAIPLTIPFSSSPLCFIMVFVKSLKEPFMYQYLLFDLDGTLTNPKEGITKSVQ